MTTVEFDAYVEYDEKRCPTPCSIDCPQRCHETHKSPEERDHEPDKCPWLNGHLVLNPLDGCGSLSFYLRHLLAVMDHLPTPMTKVHVIFTRENGEYGLKMMKVQEG